MNTVSECLFGAFLVLALSAAVFADTTPSTTADVVPSIQCYECNSFNDPACNDPFPSKKEFLTNCTEGFGFCRKITQAVYGDNRVIRQCGKEPAKKGPNSCYLTSGYGTKSTVCTCNGGKCNGGAALKATLAHSFFLLLASSILFIL